MGSYKYSHLRKPYNKDGNIRFDFDSEEEYRHFCKGLVALYENNPGMTISSLVTHVREEYGIKIYHEKMRRILLAFECNLRRPGGQAKDITKVLNITLLKEDVDFLQDIMDNYGQSARRSAVEFIFSMMRGRPTKHFILWIDELKPVLFLWDEKHLKYMIFAENLGKLEATILEDLSVQIEEEQSLKPIKHYARQKNLTYWGDND